MPSAIRIISKKRTIYDFFGLVSTQEPAAKARKITRTSDVATRIPPRNQFANVFEFPEKDNEGSDNRNACSQHPAL